MVTKECFFCEQTKPIVEFDREQRVFDEVCNQCMQIYTDYLMEYKDDEE